MTMKWAVLQHIKEKEDNSGQICQDKISQKTHDKITKIKKYSVILYNQIMINETK
jgi:hypothetical protein